MFAKKLLIALELLVFVSAEEQVVISTWDWTGAVDVAFDALDSGHDHMDALVAGCQHCEDFPEDCGYSVGSGKPDESGATTLDALVMDGKTHAAGAVGCLIGVKHAMAVARAVMTYTGHTLLVGQDATDFALSMGFESAVLETDRTREIYQNWLDGNCQPNFWKNVEPDPTENCGPFTPAPSVSANAERPEFSESTPTNHDTIGMVVLDDDEVAAGTSTNGLTFKIKGRVGDSPVPGSGAYADETGGAAATGNGDIIMRFLPSLMTVKLMNQGLSPSEAAEEALRPIGVKYPHFRGAVVAVNIKGEYGAGCFGYATFPYKIRTGEDKETRLERINCITL